MRWMFLLLLTGLCFAVEPVLYPKKVAKTEFSLSSGFLGYSESRLDDTYYVRLGVDYRAKYPFLLGSGLRHSSTGELDKTSLDLRVKARRALVSYLKADLVGGVVLSRVETRHGRKDMGGGYGGVEFLYWFGGTYAGLSFTYNVFSDERFNHITLGLVVGF